MNLLDHDEAVAALWAGEIVAVPTDTVYGVAARLGDAAAVAQLFRVKSRPDNVALPVMVGSSEDVSNLEVEWSESAQRLAERFWPGALTIVVDASPTTARKVGAQHSVGLRSPRHEGLAAVIARCGPLAVTSANEHGHPPCTSVDEVMATPWAAPLAGVLDGGVCDGIVSTVVELTSAGWHVRRVGAVSTAQLEEVLGPESTTRDH
jgi:L-threonylcarbamoyladenylate synthase